VHDRRAPGSAHPWPATSPPWTGKARESSRACYPYPEAKGLGSGEPAPSSRDPKENR
jgi:hypothetical protein